MINESKEEFYMILERRILFNKNKKKHQHEIEVITLKNRINELEEILCPCKSHEFVEIDYNNADTTEVLLHGDYYHDKINYYIDGFLRG